MTFMGIEGKGQYKGTIIEEILPVIMKNHDDRKECPQGFSPETISKDHEAMQGLDGKWPVLLGYNDVDAKDSGETLMVYKDAPILVTGRYGKGRTFAWMSDCAPHWMPEEFCNSDMNKTLWRQLFEWCLKRDV